MNICVTVNSKYVRYLYIMLLSLFENNSTKKIDLFVIQRDFTDQDKKIISTLAKKYHCCVTYIEVDKRLFSSMLNCMPDRENLPSEIICFRLLIPELLPENIERILMLDVDIVVNGSIKELYEIDFHEKCLAAAPNMCHNFIVRKEWRRWYEEDRRNWIHYNTGILLWNLNRIRQNYSRGYIFNEAWKRNIEVATFEEEVFNVLFGENDILAIEPQKWNYISTHDDSFERPCFHVYQSLKELKKNCRIIHFAALNPWQEGAKNKSFLLWWEYAKKTPFYYEILEKCYRNCERYVCNIQKKIMNLEQLNHSLKIQSELDEKKLKYVDLLLDDKNVNRIREKFEELGIEKIMIYGAGRIAKCLAYILKKGNVEILCYIDKERREDFCEKPTIGVEQIKEYEERTDMILVSLSYYYNEIEKLLRNCTSLEICSIDEMIQEPSY